MLYPMFVNLIGKKVVIIGGGPIATRKLKGLIETKASITVISPTLSEEMRNLVLNHPIDWLERVYQDGDLEGSHLIVVATPDKQANQRILNQVKDWQWINRADGADQGNFQIPAQVNRGKLTIAVSTEGASPELSKQIKTDLSNQYGKAYESYLDFLFQCRERVKAMQLSEGEKRFILGLLLEPDLLDPIKQQEVLNEFSMFVKEGLGVSPIQMKSKISY
ncbi:MAG TPA: NAD(P)-dependent oxidoreductase [Candidatus Angelobacter sp.]|nr:NAD(P)-dependent oxidoreductase [Candidatus Angelobacter sp.]